MRHRAAQRDAHPDDAHIGRRNSHACRLRQQGEIRCHTVGDEMARADAVPGIFNALKFLNCCLLDLAHNAAKGNIAGKINTGLGNRLYCDECRGEPALHVIGAESPDPAVTKDRLRLESLAYEMLLLSGIRGVHVAGEQEIKPVAAPAPVPDCVRPVCTHEL